MMKTLILLLIGLPSLIEVDSVPRRSLNQKPRTTTAAVSSSLAHGNLVSRGNAFQQRADRCGFCTTLILPGFLALYAGRRHTSEIFLSEIPIKFKKYLYNLSL